ncbi:MAG: hypothetical protein J6I35_09680 [Ruminobacter sp.]|uniref:hypothetical protein n=1 Tax=Ruminobacter sp. TaxID=2774296 RepID=UPI001B69353A|nr:hypothetical protein [Ruminobacter sp.]MBP3749792.1 hypothetical protein [Ruminobacter sp.]
MTVLTDVLKTMQEQGLAAEAEAGKKRIAHIYCQTGDGTLYEVPLRRAGTVEIKVNNISVKLPGIATDGVIISTFDSVKELKELVKSDNDDFMEALIDKSSFKFTELANKIIRNIEPNEDNISRLYKSLKTIEKRAEWFDASKLLGYSDIDGDSATIVTSVLKESIKGKVVEMREGFGFSSAHLVARFKLNKKIPKKLKLIINDIFNGYTYPNDDFFNSTEDEETKNQILKVIGFFVELADLLSD